jgi:hypothetical protein
MAKRLTDSNKWDKSTFMDLTPKMKLAWIYLCDKCNHAGIWDVNFKLMQLHTGFEFTIDELVESFGDKIRVISNKKVFVPSFIYFQYGELTKTNNTHKSVLSILQKAGVLEPLGNPSIGDQDKDKDKDKDLLSLKSAEKLSLKDAKLHELIIIWNANCGGLAKVRSTNPNRDKKIHTIWPQQSPSDWAETIKHIARTPFCIGTNDRGWKATFDFLLKPDTWLKVNEGVYDNLHKNQSKASAEKKHFAEPIRGFHSV